MTKYNTDYRPPAPFAEITISNIDSPGSTQPVQMLLDTGSDITLLPRRLCEEIGVEIEDRSLDLIGFDGSISLGFYVYLDLVFLDKLFRGDFLVYDDDEGIIGRDLLNEFQIVFDGPNTEWRKLNPEFDSSLIS